jgi:hypothetical protein
VLGSGALHHWQKWQNFSPARTLVPCPPSVTSLPLEGEDDTKSKVPTKCYVELSRSFVVCRCTIGTIRKADMSPCETITRFTTTAFSIVRVVGVSYSSSSVSTSSTSIDGDHRVARCGGHGDLRKPLKHHQRFFLVCSLEGRLFSASCGARPQSGERVQGPTISSHPASLWCVQPAVQPSLSSRLRYHLPRSLDSSP